MTNWTPIRVGRERPSQFRDLPSKPHREEQKPRSILLLALPGITVSPSPSTFRSGIFSIPNNLPANPHGNGYADPNFLIPPTIEAVTLDGELSMFDKETTLSTLLPPTSQGNASGVSSTSRAIIATRMSWRAGALRTPRRMHGLLRKRPSVMDSWIPEVIAPAQADVGFQQ